MEIVLSLRFINNGFQINIYIYIHDELYQDKNGHINN